MLPTTRFFFISLLFFAFAPVFGQQSLTGQLLDEEGAALGFANVMLLHPEDSALVKGTVSEADGSFAFEVEEPGAYLLEVAMIGFRDYHQRINLAQSRELPTIILETEITQLSTVEVRARQPLLEQRGNKMIVNVGNSITGTSGSAMDLLRKVPGLLVINNQISMAGQSNISILINGKPTQYLDVQSLLRDYPADNIERIEVINQPGARFDAEGNGGILNIVMKKNVKLGTNGGIRLRTGRGQYWKYGAATALHYRDERVNWSNRLSYNHNSHYEEMVLDRKVGDQTFIQTNRQPYLPHSLSFNSSFDYQLTDQQEAGVAVQLFGSRNESTDENSTLLFDSENLQQELLTLNRDERQSGLYSVDAYYQVKLDTSGQKWSVDGSYYRYSREAENFLNTTELPGREPAEFPNQRQEQPGNNHIYSFQTDYELPLGEGQLLSAGLKYSYAEVDNELEAFRQNGQDWALLDSLSNHFRFNETIQAAYLSYQFTFGEVSGQAGLRYEHNHTEGYSVTLDSLNVRRAGRFFPSFSVDVPLAGKIGLTGAYSYRISRPRYGNLNPFVLTLDPYTFQKGNPFLKPELTHSGKLTLTFDKQPFFNLEYNRTRNNIQLLTAQDDATGAAFALPENLDFHEKIGGSLFFPLSFLPGLSGYAGVMAHYHRFRSELFGDLYNQNRWNVTGFLQANYKISETWSAEASGWYSGPGVRGIMTYDGLYSMSFGVKKELWDGRGELALSADDMIFRYWTGEINFSNMDIDILSKWETRRVSLSFLYKFGNRHLKKGASRSSSAGDEKRRMQD
jgi:hypothetical protein